MGSKGRIVIKSGKGRVHPNGRLAVFRQNGSCPDCCCRPKILASHTTTNYETWDLRPYQGDGQAPPGSFWRLREAGAGLTYGSGRVDENGRLVGLPDSFTSNYYYAGYMQLEIGCLQPDGTIKWP